MHQKIRQINQWIEGWTNGSKCGKGSTVDATGRLFCGELGIWVFKVNLFQCCCMFGNVYVNNKMLRPILFPKRAGVFLFPTGEPEDAVVLEMMKAVYGQCGKGL